MSTYEVIEGDCLKVMAGMADASVDAIVTDPPYGIKANTRYTRMKGIAPSADFAAVHGDDAPFDPTPFLHYPAVVLFGANHFANHLSGGEWLVWYKRRYPGQSYLSDCELIWSKGARNGVWLYQHVWHGFDRASERGDKTLHPTQKPVALMEWVIRRLKLPTGATILDPYCGSGSTGVAAVNLGMNFIGIEQSAEYCAIARSRIQTAAAQPRLAGVA